MLHVPEYITRKFMKQTVNNVYVGDSVSHRQCNFPVAYDLTKRNPRKWSENKIIVVPFLPPRADDNGDFPHYARLVEDKDKEPVKEGCQASRAIELYGKTRMNRGNI